MSANKTIKSNELASGVNVRFVLSHAGKLIQQLFDYPFCLARALSTKLSLRAVHCLCELWICRLYRLSSSPGRAERLLTPQSHPYIPLSFFLHPSIPQCPVYSLQPCGRATSETLQTTKALAAASDWPGDGPHHGNNGERCRSGRGSGADGGLVVGIFSAVEGEGMIKCGCSPWHAKYIAMLLHCVAWWPLVGLLWIFRILELFSGWRPLHNHETIMREKWHFPVTI